MSNVFYFITAACAVAWMIAIVARVINAFTGGDHE